MIDHVRRPNLFSYINAFIQDPKATLIFFLLALPGRLLAISAHEYAHAWMADRCGDPTARMLGRLSMNPLKHLDPLGIVMMLIFGFGWAQPVPINPRNYRNGRRDDLKVSLAGVVMNFILFALGYIVLSFVALLAIRQLDFADRSVLMRYAMYLNPEFIVETLGWIPAQLYRMLVYFVQTNICLALFNLIPVPPLDGYHVVNDLLLKRNLFASQKAARIASGILFLLMLSGYLGDGLGYAVDGVINAAAFLMEKAFLLLGCL